MKQRFITSVIVWYHVMVIVTFLTLTFASNFVYTWWNWIFAIPINLFLSEIWPFYWLVHSFMH